MTLITTFHADLLESPGRENTLSFASKPNREHYSKRRKEQFIHARNLCQFSRQPYALWLGLGALRARPRGKFGRVQLDFASAV